MTDRKGFSSHIGFIFAGAATAIGIGALWRFPPLVANYGGGSFILLYILLTFTLGFVLLITEIAIGRKTGKSAILAYGSLNKKWNFLGYIAVLISIIVLSYYLVIGGWVMEYGALYVTDNAALTVNPDFFQNFISDPFLPVLWTVIFTIIAAVVLLFGIRKGLQRVSTILLPILLVLMIGIAVYCISLPGGLDGFMYYFIPDFSYLSVEAVLEAMGMSFFSLGIAMGIMVTYGSYLSKKENIEKSVLHIELFSTGATILAGLLIIPAFFAFSGGDMSVLKSGTGLMFTQMPMVFETMEWGGIIGAVFFICVFFAALTSAISMFEVPVSALIDRFKLSRSKAVCIVFVGISIIALIVNFGYSIWSEVSIGHYHILEFMDMISSNILMPVVALLTCIFVGWIVKGKTAVVSNEVGESSQFKTKRFYTIMIKFIAPVCILFIICFLTMKTISGI